MPGQTTDQLLTPRDSQHRVTGYYNATATSLPHELALFGDTTVGAFTLTLPHVSEMAGKTVSIQLVNNTGNRMTLVTPGDRDTKLSALVLDTDLDRVVAFCDGQTWYALSPSGYIA